MGRWSANDLSRQWKGVKLFVVDVEFGVDGEDTRCNFLLNLDGFTDMNVYSCQQYAAPEARGSD